MKPKEQILKFIQKAYENAPQPDAVNGGEGAEKNRPKMKSFGNYSTG